jgi:thioredoxin-related protein
MELRRWMDDIMRTRTAMVLFLTSMVLGAMLTFAIGVMAGESAASSKSTAQKGMQQPNWREFGAGLKEAEKQEKPMVVDVYTSWCGWCKRMDRTTYADEQVLDYMEEAFVPIKMNAESKDRAEYAGEEYTYRQIAKGFRITGYPTTLFLNADGSHITTVPGYLKPAQFLTVLRFIGDGHYKEKTFDEYRKELEQAQK